MFAGRSGTLMYVVLVLYLVVVSAVIQGAAH